MSYITSDLTVFLVVTITANISYALLFIYHLTKKDTNKSLMIIAGCLCLAMIFFHLFALYKESLPTTSDSYRFVTTNFYLIWLAENSILVLLIASLHKVFKIQYHQAAYYINRCMMISIFLNLAIYIDIIQLSNRTPYWLWTLYSYGQVSITLFMFLSVVVARKWSEVFRWTMLAHSRKTSTSTPHPRPHLTKKAPEQELNELAYHYQINKGNRAEYLINIKAIWRYIYFIYSTTEEEKQAFRQQSHINAERLLDQYRLVLQEKDYDKRMQLMEDWKHTFRLYYKNKSTEHTVKGKAVEVNFQR